MPAVAGDAGVGNMMFDDELVELLPEVDVLDFAPAVLFLSPPTIALPTGHPFAQTFANVLTVQEQFDDRGPLERFESAHHREQLHAVVGRVGFAAGGFQFLARRGMPQDKGPTAGPRIAAARAVSEEVHAWHAVCNCFFRHARRLPLAKSSCQKREKPDSTSAAVQCEVYGTELCVG